MPRTFVFVIFLTKTGFLVYEKAILITPELMDLMREENALAKPYIWRFGSVTTTYLVSSIVVFLYLFVVSTGELVK